jgi:hypothetical protein
MLLDPYLQETPAQRRAALAQRAREMAAKREAERRALADALLEESFRENCDPLRERYTRQIIYKTAAERQQQVGCVAVAKAAAAAHPWAAQGQCVVLDTVAASGW